MNSIRAPGAPPIKVFTRAMPATKLDIAAAFWDGQRFHPCPVALAWSIIGQNVPKYLLQKQLATLSEVKGVDVYTLTPSGQAWLVDGLRRHLRRHPRDAARLDLTRMTGSHDRTARPRRLRPATPAPMVATPAPRLHRPVLRMPTAGETAGRPLRKPRINLEK
jgi:hypothetical protein